MPMWSFGCPAGFCEEPAYGLPLPRSTGRYDGYVPALACPVHGGPKQPAVVEVVPEEGEQP